MTEPIALTLTEVDAAAAVVDIPGGMGFRDRQLLVETIVEAVNKFRAGDPVGTIRRSPAGWVDRSDGGDAGYATAVLTEKGWRLCHERGDCRSWLPSAGQPNRFVLDWTIVYTPEVS